MRNRIKNFTLLFASIITTITHGQSNKLLSIILDIPYVAEGSEKQKLDLYLPENSENFPTLVFVHGGSLTSGDRKDEPHDKIAKTFQELGIAFATMSYRLAPDHKWPAQPHDVVAAFDWVKTHISDYGGNEEEIYLFGHSSGCLLVSIVGSDSSYLAEKDYEQKDIAGIIPLGCLLNSTLEVGTERSPDYERYVIPPQYVDKYIERDRIYTSIEQLNNANPAKHVNKNLPRTLVLVAEGECFFPPILRDGAEFVGRALSKEAQADLKILYDRKHRSALENMISPDDPAVKLIEEFIKKK